MERGDLELWERQRIVVVIEGVLCAVSTVEERRRLRKPKATGYNVLWYDLALKRLKVLKQAWPDTGHDYVTFISDGFVDAVAPFLEAARMPYDTLAYQPFEQFVSVLRFQPEIQAVYDTDPGRLDRYGQKGVAVLRGQDF